MFASLPANATRFTFKGQSGDFSVYSFTGEEAVNRVFSFSIELVSPSANEDITSLLGTKALLRIADQSGGTRLVHGIIREMEQLQTANRFTHYRAVLAPRLYFLDKIRDHRIFQHLSADQIIATILKEQGFDEKGHEFKLFYKYEPREYCVQYGETDLHFITRLCEEEGIYFYFEHSEDAHKLCFCDREGGPKIPGENTLRFHSGSGHVADTAVISRLNVKSRINSNASTYREWNFEKPRLNLEVRTSEPDSQKAPVPQGMSLEHYQYPHLYQLQREGTRYARLQLLRQLTFATWIECESDVARFLPSYTFSIYEHPRDDINAKWWVVSVHHEGKQPGVLEHEAPDGRGLQYRSSVVAIPEMTRFVPELVHPKNLAPGQQTAIVTGPEGEEIYPDEYGRVKVQFFWDREGKWDDKTTCWIRVSQGWAGSQYGIMAIPRIGHEVIVSFLEGNPDRPLITGRVYHALNTPPYELPEHKTRTVFKSASTPGEEGEKRGFNELRIEDKKGEEEIYVHAEKDVNVHVKNDWSEHILHDKKKVVENSTYLETKGETHETLKKDRKTELLESDHLTIHKKWLTKVGDEMHVKAGSKVVLEAGAEFTIKGGGHWIHLDSSGIRTSPRLFVGGPPVGGSISPAPPVCPMCEKIAAAGASISTASPHPVHALSGCKFLTEEPDFALPGRIPIVWTRIYNSLNTHAGPFGPGWSAPYFIRLVVNRPGGNPDDAPHCLINPQGREIPFLAIKPGEFTMQPSEGLTLRRGDDGSYAVEADTISYRFALPDGDRKQQTLVLEKIEDKNGNTVVLEYDEQGRLIKLGDQAGQTLLLEYSENFPQRIARIRGGIPSEERGEAFIRPLASYEYDLSGRLASIARADGESCRTFAYHDSGPGVGLMASHTLPSGLRCDYEWETFPDHPRVVRHGTNDGMEWTSAYTFNADGGETTVTDSLGGARVWRWNKHYLPLQYTNAAKETWLMNWNKQNQMFLCALPNGGEYSYVYDGSCNPVRITDPEGGSTSFVWDSRQPLLLSTTDEDGHTTQFEYDDRGNRVLVLLPNGGEERFRYDDSGNLVERVTPIGGAHRYEWDTFGRLLRYTDCSGNAHSLAYDANGHLASSTDPLGQTSSVERDIVGNPLVITHPDGSTQQYTWDKAGRPAASTDGQGAVTLYRYNMQNQVVEKKDACGGVTSLLYDPAGNMLNMANANGEKYSFTYDAEGRRLSYTGLDGVRNEYTLDALGLPARIRYAAETEMETAVAFERDKLGRVICREGETGRTTYRYTPGGRIEHVEKIDAQGRKTSAVSRVYDSLGALVEEKNLVGLLGGATAERILRHEYDLAGNRIRSLLPGGEAADFTPCSSGHVHQINFAAGTGEPERIISAFERDALNRETLRTQGMLHSRRDYDPLSRVVRMHTGRHLHEDQTGALGIPMETSPLVAKHFRYDANGELHMSEDIFSGTQQYAYDALGRITSIRKSSHDYAYRSMPGEQIAARSGVKNHLDDENFRYDRAGNLFSLEPASSAQAAYGAASRQEGNPHVRHNRLESLDGFTFTHDLRGRVVEKRCARTGATWQYYYNSDNQLTEARVVSASGSASTRFSYDALGRRTSVFDGLSETLFLWDGVRLLQEERGAAVTTYFYEQGGYAPLARVDGRNSFAQKNGAGIDGIFYYHCNPAGLPEDVTDSEGNVVWRGRYSAWGKLVYEHTTRHAPGGFRQPLRMQGQYDDGTTGLYYNTFRYYDPDAGRFTAEDPIGLDGGDNLYQYAPNALRWSDPLGLSGTLEVHSSGSDLLGGHSWVVYTPDGGTPTTYGTWGNNPHGLGNGLHKNLEQGLKGEALRSMHLDDAAEKNLMDKIKSYEDAGEDAWKLGSPCSSFARDTWKTATGENLNSNIWNGFGPISNPETLKKSIIKANGGAATGTMKKANEASSNSASSGSIGRRSGSSINSAGSLL